MERKDLYKNYPVRYIFEMTKYECHQKDGGTLTLEEFLKAFFCHRIQK